MKSTPIYSNLQKILFRIVVIFLLYSSSNCAQFPNIDFGFLNGAELLLSPNEVTIITANTVASISWNSINSATSYNVYRSTETGFLASPSTLLVSSISSFTYMDATLINGKEYFYKISSLRNNEESPLSNEYTITIVPSPTVFYSATLSGNVVHLIWGSTYGVSQYKILRSPPLNFPFSNNDTPKYTTTDLSYLDEDLISGTSYRYAIITNNKGGNSIASSNDIRFDTPANAPTSFTASSNNTTISLNWNAPPATASYNIYRNTSPIAEIHIANKINANPIVATNYTDSPLLNGTKYYYLLTAISTGGLESFPTQQTLLTVPNAPTNFIPTINSTSVNFTWNASTGADRYYLYRSSALPINTAGAELAFTNNTNTYTDSTINTNTRYYYTLRAWNTAASSSSNGFSILTSSSLSVLTLPGTPTNLTITAAGTTANLTWTAPSNGATDYAIYRSTSNIVLANAANKINTVSVLGTSYTDTGLSNGLIYYYVITSNNATGESPPTAPVNVNIVPAAPTNFTGDRLSASSTNYRWTLSTGATSYEVYKSTTSPVGIMGGNLNAITTFDTVSSNDDGLLLPGQEYFAVVIAKSAAGDSAPSSEVRSIRPTLPPTNLQIVATQNIAMTQMALTWTSPANAIIHGYQINREPGGVVAYSKSTSYTDNVLSNGATYTYTIWGTSYGLPSSNSISLSLRSLPQAPTITITSTSGALLSFSNLSHAITSYEIYRDTVTNFIPSDSNRIATSLSASYTDTSIPIHIHQTYYYKVIARNATGASLPSAQATYVYIPLNLSTSLLWASASSPPQLSFILNTSSPWSIQHNTLAWLTLSRTSGASGGSIAIRVSPSSLVLPRSGKIPFISNSIVRWLTINQLPISNFTSTPGPSETFQIPEGISTIWVTIYGGSGGRGANGAPDTCGEAGNAGTAGSNPTGRSFTMNVDSNTNISYFIGNSGLAATGTVAASSSTHGGPQGSADRLDPASPAVSTVGFLCGGGQGVVQTPATRGGGGGSSGGGSSFSYGTQVLRTSGGNGGNGGNGLGMFDTGQRYIGGTGGTATPAVNTSWSAGFANEAASAVNSRGSILVRYQ